MSSTHIFVINEHTSTNEFTHPVPRIGSGEIFPVGPTSFQFIVPDDAPVTISPAVGTLSPGQVQINLYNNSNQYSNFKCFLFYGNAVEFSACLDYQY